MYLGCKHTGQEDEKVGCNASYLQWLSLGCCSESLYGHACLFVLALLPVHSQITLLSSLKTFVVSSNRFSGTVNENIYFLPALAKLDLSNNALVGTLPKAIG